MRKNLNKREVFQKGVLEQMFCLGRIAEYLGGPDYVEYVQELIENDDLLSGMEHNAASVVEWETKRFPSIFSMRVYRLALYCIVRSKQPNTYLETGVLHGLSSSFILAGMKVNGNGQLYSVDAPSYPETGVANKDGYDYLLPKGKEPGWIIPDYLRSKWILKKSTSVASFPSLLPTLNGVDIFCHDSEHVSRTMWYELNEVWPYINQGGVIICDNVESCAAFFDFCRYVGRTPLILPNMDQSEFHGVGFAIIQK